MHIHSQLKPENKFGFSSLVSSFHKRGVNEQKQTVPHQSASSERKVHFMFCQLVIQVLLVLLLCIASPFGDTGAACDSTIASTIDATSAACVFTIASTIAATSAVCATSIASTIAATGATTASDTAT